jgi:predicted RNase H-like HicB family nuclease
LIPSLKCNTIAVVILKRSFIMSALHVTFTIKVPIEVIKRKKIYAVCCPILDIHSQGDTKAKAIENIKDAVNLFFISCFERGVLDKALKECGFKPENRPVPETTRSPRITTIDVPLYLINSGRMAERCHV